MLELKEKIKKLILGYNHFSPSFSQAGEDMILRNLLRKIQNGYYVDVGAYHPTAGSNTYYFYRFQGWRGINVEPNPDAVDLFKKLRPEDINLNIGISDQEKEMDYYIHKDNPVMNSFSMDFVEDQTGEGSVRESIKVQTAPLRQILSDHVPQGKSIDLLNVDAEGLDLQVLQSNDWVRFRPMVVIVEVDIHGSEESPISNFLKELNYVLVGMTPVNTQMVMSCIYFDKKSYSDFNNY